MKRKKMTKAHSSRIHFKKRMLERFDVEINRHDIRELVQDIQNGNNVIYSEKLSSRVSVHTVIFMGKKCNVIYDKKRKVPVTAKPLDMDIESYSGSCHNQERMFK